MIKTRAFNMNTLTKGAIGFLAIIAVGAFGIGTLSDERPRPTPASIIAERFVFAIETQEPTGEGVDLTAARRDAAAALSAITLPIDALARKGDRLEAHAERWGRYVTFQRQTAPSTSEATRVPVADVANR